MGDGAAQRTDGGWSCCQHYTPAREMLHGICPYNAIHAAHGKPCQEASQNGVKARI
jgi:hypothetical protein